MVKRTWLVAACAVLLVAVAVPALAQERATLVLRSGERVSGELVDHGGVGFTMTVNGQTRVIPTHEVAVVDFTGSGENFPESELSKLGATHLIVLRNGETVTGEFYDIGGTRPLRVTVKIAGGDRYYTSSEVARIYLTRPTAAAPATPEVAPTTGVLPGEGDTIDVVSTAQWTPTSIVVRQGERIYFAATGEVRLGGDPNELARPAGVTTGRRASASAPMPGAPAGALIGRIGNGRAFLIGSQASVRMPANGQLFLGVNDDHLADNTGDFNVVVRRTPEPAPQPQRRRR